MKKKVDKEEEETAPPAPAKNHTDAVDHLHWLVEYVEGQQDEEIITILHLTNLLRRTQLRSTKGRVHKKKLTDYFMKH